ncbi:facilitated trehalose transporter Tret1-like [Ostrinia furnacalis]|uniref:facilitated trehalose transporter Tret1-like n=1 Tax=Ostrinia furnacalis TaxID=93504 RepID=UPI001038EAD7|nr:facilitated trehalose transporter Tret1-like [Ostrinia furnacalis]
MDEVKKKSIVPFLRQCFVTAGVSLNVLGHGAVVGFSAFLIPGLRQPDSHIKTTLADESSIASIVGIALIVGNLIMTLIAARLGRKKSHILTTIPIIIGWIIIVLANSVTALVFARFLQGVSMGMHAPLGSVIVAEMTDPANRGALISCLSLSFAIGNFICHTVGGYLTWQHSALAMLIVPFSSLIIIVLSPESPAWLISKGRNDEATKVFYWLRGKSEEEDAELERMITAQSVIRKSSVIGQDLPFNTRIRRFLRYVNETFRKPEFYKPILIMMFVYITFQFSGTNVINSYALDIIKQLVGPDANAKFLLMAMDVNRIICSLIAVFLMRKLNRRTMLIGSGAAVILCYYAKGAFVQAKQSGILPPALEGQWLPILILAVYVTMAVGCSILPFALAGEIFPLAYRGLAGGISSTLWSLNYFIAVKSFPILVVNVGLPLTYLLYGCVMVVCLVFLYFSLPETKDKTLQAIEDGFRGLTAADKKAAEPLAEESKETMRRNSSVIIIN